MSCCCTRIYKLCDLILCDGEDLVLPIPIPADGEYILLLDFMESVIEKFATLSSGDMATFDKDELNEQFTYQGQVKDPDGKVVTFDIEGKTYDCIEFTTKKKIDDQTPSSSEIKAPRCCNYEHRQYVSADTWPINHNLGYYPNVMVVDEDGKEVGGAIEVINNKLLIINFNVPFTGRAFLS